MKFNVFDRLETSRLVLRRHRSEDLDAFSEFLADPAATAYLAFTPEQRTRGGAEQMLQFVMDSYDTTEPILSFTIADTETDSYLGSCGLNPLEGEAGFEVFYTVVADHQNRGIATEAGRGLLEYLFETTSVRMVVAYVVPENLPSVRVAEKLGFVDHGPVARRAQTGDILHETLSSHRYVLER